MKANLHRHPACAAAIRKPTALTGPGRILLVDEPPLLVSFALALIYKLPCAQLFIVILQ
jgi:hypothetical protein